MAADLSSYKRLGHTEYIPLVGGDKAVEEPWRIALALLHKAFGHQGFEYAMQLFPGLPGEKLMLVTDALEKNINVAHSCGLGRLFDAVAALTGLCLEPTFEAEGPMRLEAVADRNADASYPLVINDILLLDPIITSIINDIKNGVAVSVISGRFHNTMATFAIESAVRVGKERGINKVVVSGGSFQNGLLSEKIIKGLKKKSFTTFMQSQVSPNDGGISLGQLVVAAKRRELLCV